MPRKRKTKRRKSAKRVKRGKQLAKTLPRDASGKFLPRGSKNLFRKGKKAKRRSTSSRVTKRKRAAPRSTPMKRRRSTAATKDNFPNFQSGQILLTGANPDFVTTRVNTPIPRLKVQGNRATVMELLWLDVMFRGDPTNGVNNEKIFTMTIGTIPTLATQTTWDKPTTVAALKVFTIGLSSTAAEGSSTNALFPEPHRYDFQSKNGFGYLLASDAFNMNMFTVGITGASSANWKLFYRFVDIPLQEFIGIVQSTQQI